MRAKSKELLDNLNKIAGKPENRFEERKIWSDCNKIWKSMIDSGTDSLPTSYDKDKWIEAPDDEDGDVYKWIDRVYGGLHDTQSIQQKDGTTYKGKLYHKRRLIKGTDGNNFYQRCTVTSDGRWFDNSGFPIEPPKSVDIEPEAKPDEEDIEEQKRIAREREQRIIAGLK